jgi:hypothetical protein
MENKNKKWENSTGLALTARPRAAGLVEESGQPAHAIGGTARTRSPRQLARVVARSAAAREGH